MHGKRIDRAIEDYSEFSKRKGKRASTKGAFYASDLDRIRDRNMTSEGVNLYKVIVDALRAGFMIGYRCAKREQRTKRSR